MKAVTIERWRKAQAREARFQMKQQLTQSWGYKNAIMLIQTCNLIRDKSRIVDIGGGSDPIINYIDKGERHCLDPLMSIFHKNSSLTDIFWIQGIGEELPYRSNSFDLVFCMNVLDHVQDPKKVIKEISLIIKKEGLLILSVDCCSPFVKLYREIRERFKVGEIFHPQSISAEALLKALKKTNFKVIYLSRLVKLWRNRFLNHIREGNIKGVIHITIMATLSKSWSKLTRNLITKNDGMFLFVVRKR